MFVKNIRAGDRRKSPHAPFSKDFQLTAVRRLSAVHLKLAAVRRPNEPPAV